MTDLVPFQPKTIHKKILAVSETFARLDNKITRLPRIYRKAMNTVLSIEDIFSLLPQAHLNVYGTPFSAQAQIAVFNDVSRM